MSGVCNDCHNHPCVCGIDQAGSAVERKVRLTLTDFTWEDYENYRARIAMAETITLTREKFTEILDFIEDQDNRMQIIAGHRDDYRKELKALKNQLGAEEA